VRSVPDPSSFTPPPVLWGRETWYSLPSADPPSIPYSFLDQITGLPNVDTCRLSTMYFTRGSRPLALRSTLSLFNTTIAQYNGGCTTSVARVARGTHGRLSLTTPTPSFTSLPSALMTKWVNRVSPVDGLSQAVSFAPFSTSKRTR
jgi:hypothetical protein